LLLIVASTTHILAFHIPIPTSHINVPHINIGSAAAPTPIGLVPNAAIKPINNVTSAGGVAKSEVAPPTQVIELIACKQSLSAAAKNVVVRLEDVGNAVSDTNAAVANAHVTAELSISGDVGNTIMTIGPELHRIRLHRCDRGGTDCSGSNSAGSPLSEPLAAAIRAAEERFEPQAKHLPADPKAQLATPTLQTFWPKPFGPSGRRWASTTHLIGYRL
jgi:hypothetical protein